MHNVIQLKRRLFRALIAVELIMAWLGLAPGAQAVVPAPDGGYPGGNTAEGQAALLSLTTGGFNTAVGFFSLRNDTTSSFNTAVGAGALLSNTADSNTAIGAGALLTNASGTGNTAHGAFALFNNYTGSSNTAAGYQALLSNTGGTGNTAFRWGALTSNIDADQNTATGFQALQNNTAASNTAVGYQALQSNAAGMFNTAIGAQALQRNQDGSDNTATGYQALLFNTSASNTADGYQALLNNTTDQTNTAVGIYALYNNITGNTNIAVGNYAGGNLYNSSENIDIGNMGVAGDSLTTRIGTSQTKTFSAGIRGATTQNADAIPVLIDSAGQLGTTSSSRRFKKAIKPIAKASEAVLGLNPVTFHYNSDKTDTPQFGLIAEEVAEVNADLVVRDEKGEIYTVRYDAVNAMLLNEFLKEHYKVQDLEARLVQQQKNFQSKFTEQKKQIEALASGLQKVRVQIEATKPAPQVAVNNQ
jgi:hypothetical protein